MELLPIDVEKVADMIRHVAATEVVPRFKNLQSGDVREKNPGDFVTIADEASEKALAEALTAYLPESVAIGEEAVSKDAATLDKFNEDKPVWVIDPIDGTYNFAHGRSHFGILVSLAYRGVTQYGWVYDVLQDRMAIATKGRGATLDGTPLQMRKTVTDIKKMSGMGGGAQAWHFEPANGIVGEIRNIRSALHDFLTLATGDADFVVHVNRVTPWDHGATILLAEEAGAYVRLAPEKTPFKPDMMQPCMLIAAADEEKWDALETALYGILARKRAG